MSTLHACTLGPTPYREGLALQEALVRLRAEGRTGDWLLFPEHPAVLTIGRNPSEGNVRADRATLERLGVEVFEVARGGDVTWHGPGQLVGYPVVDLGIVNRDLHRWLRTLEEALLRTLAHWGLAGKRSAGRTGVWLGPEKVASIGVAVRRWVGYHGFALNVSPDLEGFELIHPCGLQGVRMTSMARQLGERTPSLDEVRVVVARQMAELLGYGAVAEVPATELRHLVNTAGAAGTSNPTSGAGVAPA
jgi:lipoate-protein ligase B